MFLNRSVLQNIYIFEVDKDCIVGHLKAFRINGLSGTKQSVKNNIGNKKSKEIIIFVHALDYLEFHYTPISYINSLSADMQRKRVTITINQSAY